MILRSRLSDKIVHIRSPAYTGVSHIRVHLLIKSANCNNTYTCQLPNLVFHYKSEQDANSIKSRERKTNLSYQLLESFKPSPFAHERGLDTKPRTRSELLQNYRLRNASEIFDCVRRSIVMHPQTFATRLKSLRKTGRVL